MLMPRWAILASLLLLLLLSSISLSSSESSDSNKRRSVIDVAGGPHSVVWVVQLSDLHFSIFHPERAQDFKRLVAPALAMINPSLVLITGDLTGLFEGRQVMPRRWQRKGNWFSALKRAFTAT